jgi:hypothetical protein
VRKIIKGILPFFFMLIIALGSVIVSCAHQRGTFTRSGQDEYFHRLNLGFDSNGKLIVNVIFERIDSVYVIDRNDKSRRIKLEKDDWTYFQETHEVRILKEMPFSEFVVHIEGWCKKPYRFYLGGDDVKNIFVMLGERMGFDSYDYTWDKSLQTLTFEKEIDPLKTGYYIQYQTASGSRGFGSIDITTHETYPYLQAEYITKLKNKELASRHTFHFLDPDTPQGQKPEVIQRDLTPEERNRILNKPLEVTFYRCNYSAVEIGKEVGFEPDIPDSITGSSGNTVFAGRGFIIKQVMYPEGGKYLVEKMYYDESDNYIYIKMSKDEPFPMDDNFNEQFIIERKKFDYHNIHGIEEIQYWGLTTFRGTGDEMNARVDRIAQYTWQYENTWYTAVLNNDTHTYYDELIAAVLEHQSR